MLQPDAFEWTQQADAHKEQKQKHDTRHHRRSSHSTQELRQEPEEERQTKMQPQQLLHDQHQRNHSIPQVIPALDEQQHSNGTIGGGAKDAADATAHSRAHSREIPAASQLKQTQPQPHRASYSTDAYRSFMQQANGGSAAVSAANSRNPSRRGSFDGSAHSSAASSGFSSMAPSGSNTRVPSPSNMTNAFGFDPSSLHSDAEASIATAAARKNAAALEHQIKPTQSYMDLTQQQSQQPHQHHRRSLPLSGQSGQLSLAGLALQHSSSAESLDGESMLTYAPGSQARIRPVHFTFAQADVANSLRKSAEKEKARLQLQMEREREAQQRAAIAQEYELAKTQKQMQHQREQSMREAALKLAAQRKELDAQRIRDAREDALSSSDDDAHSGSSSDAYSTASEGEEDSFDRASPHPRQRRARGQRRTPILPTHFKFDATDVRRSYAKPSARQQIGPWTGFPRSSTVMLPGSQLRSVLNRRIAAQMQQAEGERKLASAPTSPSSHRDHALDAHYNHTQSIRQQLGDKSGSFSSREAQQQRAQARRASLPLINSFPPAAAANYSGNHHAHTSSAPSLPPIDHSRSNTAAHLPQPQPQRARSAGQQHQHQHSSSFDADKSKSQLDLKHSRSGSSLVHHQNNEKNTSIRAASSGHTRTSSADAVDFSKLYQQEHASGRASAAVPIKALPQANTDAAATAAAPRRSAIAHHGSRLTSSTHVSPLRRERMVQAQARSATLPAGYQPLSSSSSHAHLPPTQPGSVLSTQTISRRMPSAAAAAMLASSGGGESKVGSASSSPMAASSLAHSHSASVDYRSTAGHGLPPVAHSKHYQHSIDNWNTPLQHYQPQQQQQSRHPIPLASLYSNVNSSGYGQRR